jgi:hypothetical protein
MSGYDYLLAQHHSLDEQNPLLQQGLTNYLKIQESPQNSMCLEGDMKQAAD